MAQPIRIQIRRLRGPKAGEEWTETIPLPPEGTIVVGRGPDAALRLDHSTVSLSHLAILQAQGMFWLQDLGSQNGTRLGSNRLAPQAKTACAAGDFFFVGPFALSILDPALDRPLGEAGSTQSLALEAVLKLLQDSAVDTAFLTVTSGPLSRTRFPLPIGRPLLLGRDPGTHIMFSDPKVSHKHARIYADAEGVWLEDLHSTHGTFVDDRRISGLWKLSTGQTIRIGDTTLEFEDPAEVVLHDLEAAADKLLRSHPQPLAPGIRDQSAPVNETAQAETQDPLPSPEDPPEENTDNESARLSPPAAGAPRNAAPNQGNQGQHSPPDRQPDGSTDVPNDLGAHHADQAEPMYSFWWIAGLGGGITVILAAAVFFLWLLTK